MDEISNSAVHCEKFPCVECFDGTFSGQLCSDKEGNVSKEGAQWTKEPQYGWLRGEETTNGNEAYAIE